MHCNHIQKVRNHYISPRPQGRTDHEMTYGEGRKLKAEIKKRDRKIMAKEERDSLELPHKRMAILNAGRFEVEKIIRELHYAYGA